MQSLYLDNSVVNKILKPLFILPIFILLIPLQAQANFSCQLNKGYQLPKGLNLTTFCTFSDELASVKNKLLNKYGAVNRQGEIVIPVEYDNPVEFVRGRAFVKKGEHWLIIDTDNKQIAKFDFQDAFRFGTTGLAQVKQNDKWGFINTEGEIIVEPKFDSITYGVSYPILNEEVVAIVELRGHLGVINKKGETIVPIEFDEIYNEDNIILAIKNDKMGIYDYSGRVILPVEYEPSIGFISDSGWTDRNWLPLVKDGKMGAIDTKGNIVVPVKFDDVEIISESSFKVSKEGKYGIYGVNNLQVPLHYDFIGESSNHLVRVKLNGKWGYIDEFNSFMPVDYDHAHDFNEGLAIVGNYKQRDQSQNPKDDMILWGFINTLGEEVIAVEYEDVTPFKEGLATVKLNGKWGVIDSQGNNIIPFEHDAISSFEQGYAIVAKQNGNEPLCKGYRYVDFENDIRSEVEVKAAAEAAAAAAEEDAASDKMSLTSEALPCDNKSLYIDFMINREYSNMKFGMISSQGKVVLPVKFDNITRVSEGMVGVKNKGKWGFVTQHGELVLPYQFDRINPPFQNGTIQVDICIDDSGNRISCDYDEVNIYTRHIDKYGNIINELWSSLGVAEEPEAVD